MADSPIFQAAPKTDHVIVADTDTTLNKALVTAGANGALVDSVAVTSTDTSVAIVDVYVKEGATSYQIGQISVQAGAGTNGVTLSQNLLDVVALPFLQTEGGLVLGAGAILEVAANATLTAGKKIEFTAFGGDY